MTEPLPYGSFFPLMNRATVILTDSGGVQEEGPSLGKPVLVMRETTERPEAVRAGTVKLVGTDEDVIADTVGRLLTDPAAYAAMANAVNPYGDGQAAHRAVAALAHHFRLGPAPDEFDSLAANPAASRQEPVTGPPTLAWPADRRHDLTIARSRFRFSTSSPVSGGEGSSEHAHKRIFIAAAAALAPLGSAGHAGLPAGPHPAQRTTVQATELAARVSGVTRTATRVRACRLRRNHRAACPGSGPATAPRPYGPSAGRPR